MASKSGVGCLSVMLLLSIGLNVFLLGCNGKTFHDNDWDRQPSNVSKNTGAYADLSELRQLANSLGIPEEKTSTLSMEGLVSEIKIKLDETTKYHGKVLSEEEMKVLSINLSDDPAILNTVKEYNSFVRKLNGKKIIVLP
jgi:hypothetical protein